MNRSVIPVSLKAQKDVLDYKARLELHNKCPRRLKAHRNLGPFQPHSEKSIGSKFLVVTEESPLVCQRTNLHCVTNCHLVYSSQCQLSRALDKRVFYFLPKRYNLLPKKQLSE